MSNTYQKGIVEFQTGMQHPVKQGEKEIAVCICYKKVDISKFIFVFFLWIIIGLGVGIHKDGFV